MLKKYLWVLEMTTLMVFVAGEPPSRAFTDNTLLRLMSQHTSSIHGSKTYHPLGDSRDPIIQGISHRPTLKGTKSSYEHQNDSGFSQEYMWSSPSLQNFTSTNYYDFSKLPYGYRGLSGGASGFFYGDDVEKIHSKYPNQQIRPLMGGSVAIKSKLPNNLKEKLQILSFNTSVKPKKTNFYQYPSDFKKPVSSRVVQPYSKYKYPVRSHPLYRRFYYQSPYQRYAIPSNDMLHYKGINTIGNYLKTSTASPNQDPGKRYTTERMDDTYSEGSTWEDYSTYNDTNHDTSGSYYEEAYEEMEKTIPNSEESSYAEGTTRGYYGDRIYMSTQMPLVTNDKTGVKNKYFIIRKTSHDDDIQTLFE